MVRRKALQTAVSLWGLIAGCWPAHGQNVIGQGVDLGELHRALAPRMARSETGLPLLITSEELSGRLSGQVLATLDIPFDRLRAAMEKPETWCEILILHLNTKHCVLLPGATPVLRMAIARKHDHSAGQSQHLDLTWRMLKSTPASISVGLAADTGPLGTSDYRVSFQAIPVDADRSFVAFGYSSQFTATARMAMLAYLATWGSNKVGFSRAADGQSLVTGLRGVVERTAMRYYLGINAWFDGTERPAAERRRYRFERWFYLTELYPRQLREVDRATYLTDKLSAESRQSGTSSQ